MQALAQVQQDLDGKKEELYQRIKEMYVSK